MAIMTSIATILLMFPQIPVFGGFMKLDFSILPALLVFYILDLSSALVVLLVRSFLVILLGASPIGVPVNYIALACFISAVWLFNKDNYKFNTMRFLLGGIFGTMFSTLVMLFLNYFVALPLYEKFMNFKLASVGMDLKQWLVTMVLPFNLIQGAIFTAVGTIFLTLFNSILQKQSAKYR